MKKLFITTAIAALLSANVFASGAAKSTIDDSNLVTYTALSNFNNEFLRASDVSWTVTSKFQKAVFTQDGVKMTAFYNLRGEYMGTTTNVQFNELSERARKQIATKYEGYFAKEIIKLETEDNTTYFVNLSKDGKDVLLKVTPGAAVSVSTQVK
jgi:uncharacterized protein with GYD domain